MARIDDRLIHGQVVLGCCEVLHATRLVLLNDAVAADPWQTRIYRSAVPPEIECHILDLTEGARLLRECDDQRSTVVVVGSPEDMLALLNAGVELGEVSLAGLHRGDHRSEELGESGVFVGERDREALRSIRRSGVRVRLQAVPGSRAVELDELLPVEDP